MFNDHSSEEAEKLADLLFETAHLASGFTVSMDYFLKSLQYGDMKVIL